MLQRSKKIFALGILSISMITSNTIVPAAEEPQSNMEAQAPEAQAPETQAPETQAPETQAPETQAPETQTPETQTPETQVSETQAPETQTPETQTPETQMPETQASETQTSETQAPEIQTSETQVPEVGGLSAKDNDKDSDKESADAKEEGIKNSPYSSNSDLIAHQNIISVKPVTRDFRYTKVDAPKIIIKAGSCIYEKQDPNSRKTGSAEKSSCAYILADESENWVYVESGSCRGFIEKKDLITGELADFLFSRGSNVPTVKTLIPLMENASVDYTKTSAYAVTVDKIYAIAKYPISIYDNVNRNKSTVVGTLDSGNLAYVLDEVGNYYFVESGNVRGFAEKCNFVTGDYAQAKISQKTENSMGVAKETVSPEENKAYYFTLTSVNEADDTSAIRTSIVDFALQFVGNPYVWGGTSLTNGADCSGFVQSIYANYGYNLPRIACDQAVYGTQIPVNEAEPGDLIFYAESGYVYHVSMYIGNGQVVHAYNSDAGIVVTGIGADAVWATRIL